MTPNRASPLPFLILVALLGLLVIACGCVKMVQNSVDPVPTPEITESVSETNYTTAVPLPPAQPAVPVAELTPLKSAAVEEVAPFLTPDPYPIIHGTQLNQTMKKDPVYTGPYEFEKTYVFRGNEVKCLRVNVAEGPLYLIYVVSPQNDCLMSPESCRGDKTKSVNRPYLTITVRDNQTREIVAEDGYGREFSSDTGNYEFILESKNMDGQLSSGGAIGTNTVSPGPRALKVYREGTFDITFEGNFLDVDVKVKTGATPASASGTISAGATSSPEEVPEEVRW